MKIKIPDDLDLLQIKMILNELSDNSCIVGGAVRDLLMGLEPNDYDFVTDVDYDKLARAFKKAGWTINEAGQQFLVLIISKNGKYYEIANYRKDGTYTDGRRPDSVDIGNMNDDSQRRDFTVNALYYNLKSGEILDPTDWGLYDIKYNYLRFVGNAVERIEEDYLRVFRFYRFLKKGFEPNRQNLKVVRRLFNKACEETKFERIRVELEKMAGIK